MRLFLNTRDDSGEPKMYDISLMDIDTLCSFLPIPNVGEKMFFPHGDQQSIVFTVTSRSYELFPSIDGEQDSVYTVTLWGWYSLNIEGERDQRL